MAIQRMAIVDGSNTVINVIVYDTGASWRPPEGCRIIQDGVFGRGSASPGGRWSGRTFIANPDPVDLPPPSLEERVRVVESRLGL